MNAYSTVGGALLISELEKRIGGLMDNDKEKLGLLMSIQGIKQDSTAIIIAETGVDMSQFSTSQHLSCWTGVSPGNHESTGKQKTQG